MKQVIAGIAFVLILGFFVNTEFRARVKGVSVRASRSVCKVLLSTKSEYGKQFAERVQEFTNYRSNWKVERIKIKELDTGYEYQVKAYNTALEARVYYAVPELNRIPDIELLYTITLGEEVEPEVEKPRQQHGPSAPAPEATE